MSQQIPVAMIGTCSRCTAKLHRKEHGGCFAAFLLLPRPVTGKSKAFCRASLSWVKDEVTRELSLSGDPDKLNHTINVTHRCSLLVHPALVVFLAGVGLYDRPVGPYF